MVLGNAKRKSNYELGKNYNVIFQTQSRTSYLPPIASQPKTLGFDRTISNFQMVFHIKAFLGKCIIWCMDMGAHDKPEFTGAVKLKIKS